MFPSFSFHFKKIKPEFTQSQEKALDKIFELPIAKKKVWIEGLFIYILFIFIFFSYRKI